MPKADAPRGCGPIRQSPKKRWGFCDRILTRRAAKLLRRLRYRSGHEASSTFGRRCFAVILPCAVNVPPPFASRASSRLGVAVGRASVFSFEMGLEDGNSLSLTEQTRYEAWQRGLSERFGFSTGLC
jgi:hypothetical protein